MLSSFSLSETLANYPGGGSVANTEFFLANDQLAPSSVQSIPCEATDPLLIADLSAEYRLRCAGDAPEATELHCANFPMLKMLVHRATRCVIVDFSFWQAAHLQRGGNLAAYRWRFVPSETQLGEYDEQFSRRLAALMVHITGERVLSLIRRENRAIAGLSKNLTLDTFASELVPLLAQGIAQLSSQNHSTAGANKPETVRLPVVGVDPRPIDREAIERFRLLDDAEVADSIVRDLDTILADETLWEGVKLTPPPSKATKD